MATGGGGGGGGGGVRAKHLFKISLMSLISTAEEPHWPEFPARPMKVQRSLVSFLLTGWAQVLSINSSKKQSSKQQPEQISEYDWQPWRTMFKNPHYELVADWRSAICGFFSSEQTSDPFTHGLYIFSFLWFSFPLFIAQMLDLLPRDRPLTCCVHFRSETSPFLLLGLHRGGWRSDGEALKSKYCWDLFSAVCHPHSATVWPSKLLRNDSHVVV